MAVTALMARELHTSTIVPDRACRIHPSVSSNQRRDFMSPRIICLSALLIAGTSVAAVGDHVRQVHPSGHTRAVLTHTGYHAGGYHQAGCGTYGFGPYAWHGHVRSYASPHSIVPRHHVYYRHAFPRSQWIYNWDDREWEHRTYDDWEDYHDDRREQWEDYRDYQEDLREEWRERWEDRFDD